MRSSAILLTLLAIVWACMSPDTASAGPPIFGNITSNQTWTAAGSPYTISQNATIAPNVTVNIETGASVTLATNAILTIDGILNISPGVSFDLRANTGIDVYGVLNASGTSGAGTIHFSSAAQVRGSWIGINVYDDAHASFDHCIISYGINNIKLSPYSGGNGSVTINNSEVSYSNEDGISVVGQGWLMSLSVTNSTISNNGFGGNIILGFGVNGINLAWDDGPINIIGNRITGNAGSGIFTSGTFADLTVQNNIISYNKTGIKTQSANSTSLSFGASSPPGAANYIFKNSDYGIQSAIELLGDPYVNITATHNWWGSPTGPKHSTNPGGTGDAVSDHVTFSPFYSGPAASLAPSSIDFGSVPVGSTASPQSIIVTNSGDLPLLLGAVALGGADSSAMALALDTCSNTTLAPAASCSVDVIFSPGTSRAYTARIDFPASSTTIPVTYTATIAGTGTTVPVSLTIGFLGTGGGTVTFNSVNYYNDATVLATNGAGVEFIAAPDQYSLFSGWGGSCAGAGACIFTTPGTTGGVTATFTRKSNPVKIEPALLFYSSITGPGGAYEGAAAAGSIIKTWGTNYTEALLFDLDKSVTLDGGYDSAFGTNTGTMTTVRGTMTVKCLMVNTVETCGSVSTRNLTIRQYP